VRFISHYLNCNLPIKTKVKKHNIRVLLFYYQTRRTRILTEFSDTEIEQQL